MPSLDFGYSKTRWFEPAANQLIKAFLAARLTVFKFDKSFHIRYAWSAKGEL